MSEQFNFEKWTSSEDITMSPTSIQVDEGYYRIILEDIYNRYKRGISEDIILYSIPVCNQFFIEECAKKEAKAKEYDRKFLDFLNSLVFGSEIHELDIIRFLETCDDLINSTSGEKSEIIKAEFYFRRMYDVFCSHDYEKIPEAVNAIKKNTPTDPTEVNVKNWGLLLKAAINAERLYDNNSQAKHLPLFSKKDSPQTTAVPRPFVAPPPLVQPQLLPPGATSSTLGARTTGSGYQTSDLLSFPHEAHGWEPGC